VKITLNRPTVEFLQQFDDLFESRSLRHHLPQLLPRLNFMFENGHIPFSKSSMRYRKRLTEPLPESRQGQRKRKGS
jgi:hypothetical protein